MKKHFWVELESPDKKLVTAALEAGADAIVLHSAGHAAAIHKLGKITVVAPDGDLVLGSDVAIVKIHNKGDEVEAARQAKSCRVIVDTTDWTIIPLENLIAQSDNLYSYVRTAAEARLAAGILETGVRGVVLRGATAQTIKDVGAAVRELEEKLALEIITVDAISAAGMGDRVCVDTCTNMEIGEGMLIGNGSSGYFLVHAEVEESEYVASRPFRVNAGAVHAYARMPEGKTKYLSELKSGVEVLLVKHDGRTERATVGRAKVERRPMLLVDGTAASGKKVALVLQNAETIRLTRDNGKPVSVVDLKPGDKVLGFTEEAGRHFGMKVTETIQER